MVQGGAEGCSLQSGGCSSLPGEAGKRDQGVVAPFQERLVNESGGCSSLPGEAGKRAQVGACVLVGVCASTYVVRCFLYNKILKAEQLQRWFSPDLGFHLKILVFMCDALCDGLFCYYCTSLLFIEHLKNEGWNDISEELMA